MDGEAPLHCLARHKFVDGEMVASAANQLLEKGAHLCQVNNSRRTAADLWKDGQEEKRILSLAQEEAVGFGWEDEPDMLEEEGFFNGGDEESDDDEGAVGYDPLRTLPPWLRDSMKKLVCFAARAIRLHNVPFSGLTPSFERFVKLH